MHNSPHHPRIAFCITAKNRTSHIRQTLPRNLADNVHYLNSVFVVLDYGDPGDLRDYLATVHELNIASGLVVVYRYDCDGPFQMAHAKNLAHRCGLLEGADILVNLDADNYTGSGFSHYVARTMTDNGPDTFLWANIIPGQGKQFRGCNGRICVTRNQFINSGGYDEKFTTWSPDDKQFNARLVRMNYIPVEIPREYLRAIPHKDGVRFREYPHAQRNAYEYEQKVNECDETVANYGRIGVGDVYRNFSNEPIHIRPIATRVFGVGLHKTATNSLHCALTILGLDSAHWGSPKRARSIWQEMKDDGRSSTVEHHYAWVDLPIPLLYRELDCAYPGSKFILTVRDESRWLTSVQNHWDYDKNKFRSTWDTDPFTHLIHKQLYGCKWPDSRTFIDRYRRHLSDVMSYFRNRPDDLLVLNVDCGDGWRELCRLLGQSIPEAEYPREYMTA